MPTDPRYIACLFEPDDLVEVRLVPKPSSLFSTAAELSALESKLQNANANHRNIYIGANPRKRRGGKAADVALARCLFIDVDRIAVDDARQRIIDAGLPEPTITVSSGHGLHAYWRLAEPMTDLASWTVAQKSLIQLVGSDKKIHDPPRIMRLAGFKNHKPPAALCIVIDADPQRRYPLADLIRVSESSEKSERSELSEESENQKSLSNVSDTLRDSGGTEKTKGPENHPLGPHDFNVSDTSESDDEYGINSPQVAAIIKMVVPTGPSQSNAGGMRLARGLKLDCGLASVPLSKIKPLFREWYQMALPFIETTDFDTAWSDFLRGWETARIPLLADPLADAFAVARQQAQDGSLPHAAKEYDNQAVQLLVAACRHLSSRGENGKFFLSSHAAARYLGIAQAQAYRFLRMLVTVGVIEVLNAGTAGRTPGARRAARYRWIGT